MCMTPKRLDAIEEWLNMHPQGNLPMMHPEAIRELISAARERNTLTAALDKAEDDRDSELYAKEDYQAAMERQIIRAEKAEAGRDALKAALLASEDSLNSALAENARLRKQITAIFDMF